MTYCTACGASASGTNFCGKCGAHLQAPPAKRAPGVPPEIAILITVGIVLAVGFFLMLTLAKKPASASAPQRPAAARSTPPPPVTVAAGAYDRFIDAIVAAGLGAEQIPGAGPGRVPGELKIMVGQAWHFLPYQVRLQGAQNMQAAWVKASGLSAAPDKARIQIVDRNGNEVGGSRVWGGSVIWVAEK